MKGTRKFFTSIFLLLFFIAVAFTGCSEPVGSLLYSVDYIKAMPRITYYGNGDRFKPAEDVKVIGVFGGVEDEIDIEKVQIKIIHKPGFIGGGEENLIPDNEIGIRFDSEGPKDVVITYNNLETSYRIAVGAPGTGEGNVWGGDDDGEGAGIIIIWDGQPWPRPKN